MTLDERARLLEIRKRGKVGRLPVSSEERTFCNEMWERFPVDYQEVEAEMQHWLKNVPWWELA
jgi:hypothetical protein